MDMEYGLLSLVILALDIWAIINVVGSTTSTGKKVLWVLFILIFQVVGLIVWFFVGPRAAKASA